MKKIKVFSLLMAVAILISASVYADNYFPATDSSGNITYYFAKAGKTFWDLNFEDSKYTLESNGNLKYDNSDKFYNNTLYLKTYANGTCTTGLDTVNTITNNNNGRSMILNADGSGEARINELQINASCSILIEQFDFAFSAVPTVGQNVVMRTNMTASDASAGYYAPIYLTTGGKLQHHTDATNVKDVSPNTWYNICQVIDLSNGLASLYVDGDYVSRVLLNKTFISVTKLNATTNNANNTNSLYYDNIKVYEATTDFELNATGGTVAVEGAPVNLEISSNYDGLISHTEILTSTDGTNYTPYNSNVAYYKPYTTYYKAVAYGAGGNELYESNVVKLVAEYVKSADMVQYDIDFDDGYEYASGSLKYNGEVIYPRNDTTMQNGLGVNAGGAAENMGIKNVSAIIGNTYGDSLFLSNTAQINEGRLWTDADIMVTEFDFAYKNLPASSFYNTVFQMSMTTDNNSSTSFDNDTRIELDSTGKMSVRTYSTMVTLLSTTSPNKWYKIHQVINTVTDKIDYYVDNQYIATINRTKNTNDYFHKFNIASNKSTGNEIYVDNLKIYSVAQPSSLKLEIVNVDYFIDGVEVDRIAEGNLTAQVTLSNNNAVNKNLKCIAAVYGTSNKLERVSFVPVSFGAEEFAKLVELDLGEVTAENSVKIFFWTINSEDLIPHGASAKME